MIFDFTDDQYAFAASVDAAVAATAPVSTLRKAWTEPDPHHDLWQQLGDIGLLGLLVPDAHGGSGATTVDAALAIERVGYHAVATPVADTAIVLPSLLAEGNELDTIASGDLRVTTVTEQACLAPFATIADRFLVVADDSVHLLGRDQITLAPVAAQDRSLDLARVIATTAQPATVVGDAARLRTLRAMTTALTQVGLCQRLLDMTVEYVQQRHQFGRPIGSFQAIKHGLADAAVDLEAARSLAWYAAYAVAHDQDDAGTAAHAAVAASSAAATRASQAALQFHGGIGFTAEHDLQLFLHRAKALQVLGGTRSAHRRAVGLDFLRRHAS